MYHWRQGLPVEAVALPEEHNVWATFYAARFKEAEHPEIAGEFLDFLLGEGRAIYERYGFEVAAAKPEGEA
jgi:ABC-type molybdate transport system substrate-binding protein